MALIGNKNNKDLYKNLLEKLIPSDIEMYVEPFGGEFGLYEIMSIKPPSAIYNDINIKLFNKAKEKYKKNNFIYCFNQDYKDIIKYFDGDNTFFFLDPPYYRREHYYSDHTFLKKENHIELSEILKTIKGRFLLSYQDRKLMRDLYKDFNIYKYTGNDMFHKPEIAITNY